MSHEPRPELLSELRALIQGARQRAAVAVNSELVSVYWHIGRRIRTDLLDGTRAEYGAKLMTDLGRSLSAEFGRGFSRSNLHRMVQFAERFPDEKIVASLRRQLSWTHFRELVAGCADKNEEQVELLELNEGSLRVASYLTELPPRELLEKKLLASIAQAKASLGSTPSHMEEESS